jgi:signal transduction histidine kinase
LPHIFDRFYRVQADRSRNTGGTGLGLAIVRAIVQAHHGSIQVDSQLNFGSKFVVSLPNRATSIKTSHQHKIN